jgi:hypothetical protein
MNVGIVERTAFRVVRDAAYRDASDALHRRLVLDRGLARDAQGRWVRRDEPPDADAALRPSLSAAFTGVVERRPNGDWSNVRSGEGGAIVRRDERRDERRGG